MQNVRLIELLLELIQKVQRLDRAECVDLRAAELVDDLALGHGGKRHLRLRGRGGRGASALALELAQDGLGAADDRFRQAREPRNLDAVAAGRRRRG